MIGVYSVRNVEVEFFPAWPRLDRSTTSTCYFSNFRVLRGDPKFDLWPWPWMTSQVKVPDKNNSYLDFFYKEWPSVGGVVILTHPFKIQVLGS